MPSTALIFPVLKYYADFIPVLATLWSATSWLLKCYFFRFSLCAFAVDIVLLILPVIKGEKEANHSSVTDFFQMLLGCYSSTCYTQGRRQGWVGEFYDRKLCFTISENISFRFRYTEFHCTV